MLTRLLELAGGDRRSVLGGLAVVVVIVGLAWVLLRPDPPRSEDLIPVAAPSSLAPPTTGPSAGPPSAAATPVIAHAAGSVLMPGLYELPADSRVADLLRAAGGPAPDADLDRLNLAALVADGSRVYVPAVGEEVIPEPLDPPGAPAAGPAGDGSSGGTAPALVDLNSATLEELDELPGVGPATAQAIIDHRTGGGGFSTVDELLEVRGIGEAKLADLRDLVTVG